jgi:ATP-dependent Lhr-like helicase
LLDQLHPPTIRAVAAIRLLLRGFVEPSAPSPEVASTLIHQILSVIAERGGIRPPALYQVLCGPGPFDTFSQSDFAVLLRHMADGNIKLIEQAPDSTLMLGAVGEQIVQSRDFFAVFETAEEWRLTSGGRTLGTLPISFPVHKDSLVVFAGRRWIVESLDERMKTLQVLPHPGGMVPRFERANVEPAHDELAAEMRAMYLADDVPPYLDAPAREFLAEGRAMFRTLKLDGRSLIEDERDLHVFLWRGSQANTVFGAALAMAGLAAESHDFGVTIAETNVNDGAALLRKVADMKALTSADVAEFVQNIRVGKFAEFVPEALARAQWARQNTDVINDIPAMALAATR